MRDGDMRGKIAVYLLSPSPDHFSHKLRSTCLFPVSLLH